MQLRRFDNEKCSGRVIDSMKSGKTYCSLTVLLIGTLLLTSCVTSVVLENLVPDRFVGFYKKHPYSIRLAAGGGPEPNPHITTITITNEEYQQALEATLKKAGVFSKITEGMDADYSLNVFIFDVEFTGVFELTFKLESIWKLTHVGTGKVIMYKSIISSNTVTVGDAFVGVTRYRIVREGAVRKNIQSGIESLSLLNL